VTSAKRPAAIESVRTTNGEHRAELKAGAWLEYRAGWLPAALATTLKQTLIETVDWEQRSIWLFGRPIMQPRLISWCGSVGYRYSGQTLEPRRVPPIIAELLESVSDCARVRFNHVLLNRYRNGEDSMGWHADDEAELGKNPAIASLSLGVARRFLLKPKRAAHGRSLHLTLEHGSLLLMGGSCQHHYRHCVPKQALLAEERVNLTFRAIVR
jgi:alkylated DNA repair dioxygenase AlkB